MSSASDYLIERLRAYFGEHPTIREKTMFGSRAFMRDGNMVCAVVNDGDVLLRVGKDDYAAALSEPGVGPMTMGSRTMTGFVVLDADAIEDDADLARWLDRTSAFVATLPPK